jgi:hypothetical protein
MAATLEDQLLQLLAETHLPAPGPRKQAEQNLEQAQTNPAFPGSLCAIASHSSVSPEIRQSALLILRSFVEKNWSGQDESGPTIVVSDTTKEQLRVQLLELATSSEADRKIKSAARYETSKEIGDTWNENACISWIIRMELIQPKSYNSTLAPF